MSNVRIPNVLPKRLRPYAKALYPAVASAATIGVNYAFGNPLDIDGLRAAAGAVVLTLLSFGVSND